MYLSRTPRIISDAADVFFDRQTESILGSYVLPTTLRYISIKSNKDAVEKTKFISCYYSETYGEIDLDSYFASEPNDCIYIYKPRNGYKINVALSENWVSLDKPPYPTALYLSQISPTSIYVNKEDHQVLVVVQKPGEKWLDQFCSTLYRILLWLYPENSTPTDEEIALFRALSTQDAESFYAIVDSCCQEIDFESVRNKRMLIGWVNKRRASQIEKFKNDRALLEADIQDRERTLTNKYHQLEDVIKTINGWMNTSEEDDMKMYDFFNTHKQLHVNRIDRNGGSDYLYFSIMETLEYYDDDVFEQFMKNKHSFLYTDATPLARKVAEALFMHKRGVFRVESGFYMIDLRQLSAKSGYRSGLYNDIALPHPHLYHHACLGGNGNYINTYMNRGDWDLAIEQAIAATKNIAFTDSVVFKELLYDIDYYKNVKCIILTDGTETTPMAFYDLLLKEELEAKTEKKEAPEEE